MKFNVLVLSTEDNGPDEVMLFSEDVTTSTIYGYAKTHGYREEYEDYWIFAGVGVSPASVANDRSKPGRYA
jgi:hypothetical protein